MAANRSNTKNAIVQAMEAMLSRTLSNKEIGKLSDFVDCLVETAKEEIKAETTKE